MQMTVKRRNHGRNKKNKGKARRVNCASSGKLVAKDKAVKRFTVRYVAGLSSLHKLLIVASCVHSTNGRSSRKLALPDECARCSQQHGGPVVHA
jgi:ribosomal protein S26